MSDNETPLILFGGTFNPPHMGHIHVAKAAISLFSDAKLGIMPAYIPPHKETLGISYAHRKQLVELAIANEPAFYVESIEESLAAPNYTVKTLQALRKQHPDRPICFLIGGDSLSSLDSWYHWQELLSLTHLVVYQRNGYQTYSAAVEATLRRSLVESVSALTSRSSGFIYTIKQEMFDISSTELRAAFKQETCDNKKRLQRWLAPQVLDYINDYRLYR